MGGNRKDNKGSFRERLLKRFPKRLRKDHEKIQSNELSAHVEASNDSTTVSPAPPAQMESILVPSPEQRKQDASKMGLWTIAASCLHPRDREKLECLVKSKLECPNGHEPDSLVDEVNSTLSRADKLKEEDNEVTWRPVVDRIIKGALAFKSLGDAAVAFDKSGYAALGWSVVSFGLQLAANAEHAREFVLSSSEVITRFMAKYMEYERIFRGPEAGEEFDRLLTNVYKALLLYMIALDKYLRQSGPERVAHAIIKLEDQSIHSNKKAVETADAEVRDWLLIIMHTRNDNNFSRIRGMIQDGDLSQIPEPSQECLKSLFFREMEDRFYDIERAAEGTCRWLLRHKKYRDWTDDFRGMICIKGKPGSGKSTLLHYAVSDAIVTSNIPDRSLLHHNEGLIGSSKAMDSQSEPNVVILSFFFHDRGTDLQKTPLGLFRSLLHQLLRRVPDAIPDTLLATFQDRVNRMGEVGEKWDWKWREVRHFFEISLQKVLESHQVCLFTDALDEYGEEDANELLKSFDSWLRGCPAQAQFRICFTCRHYPPLNSPEGMVEIRLEEENKDDISTYVQTQLSGWSNNENLATTWMDITDRASGVFIWARLIVRRVLRLERRGENWKKIKREIENTPQALDDLYRGLVQKMATEPNSLKLIQWICFSMEPLTLDELRWAIIVDADYSGKPASLRHYENTEDFATNCDMMEKKLRALSCGLAEAVPSSRVVQFIHQSVKDFFIKEGFAILHKSQNPDGAEANEADLECTAHYQLSKTCIRYFSAEEIVQSKLYDHALTGLFPFLRYAAKHWTAHVQQSEKKGPQTDLLRYFGWPSEHTVQQWCQFGSILEDWNLQEGTTLLHVAARHQLMGPLLEILQSKEQLCNKIEASDVENRTPLWWAVDQGHEAVVRLLLDNGANVNGPHDSAGCILYVATLGGEEQIIRTLLDYGADINAKGGYLGNALQVASFRGQEQIVRMLLDYGADINADGGRDGTALNSASMRGHEEVSHMLLEEGADVNAGKRDKALVLASCEGHEQTVRMLLQNGADLSARSETFGNLNSLEVASFRGHEQIIQILLEYCADPEH